MKILFLDIDGVLHPGPEVAEHKLAKFAWLPDLVRLLAPYPDVRIVVHSTWRYEYDVDELRGVLGDLGKRVVDATDKRSERYDSIRGWLYANKHLVGSYRILDDDASEFPDPPPGELILAPAHLGVTDPATQERLSTWLHSVGRK